jgi:integrase/recombinase XerD
MPAKSGGELWSADVVRVEVGRGLAYWTVLSGTMLETVGPVDHYLRHLRFGRGRAESTTKTYAGHLKRLEQWCRTLDLSWEDAARELPGHLIERRLAVRAAPGRGQGRGPSEAALGPALAAIHGFYRHAADVDDVGREGLPVLFEVAEVRVPGPDERRWPVLRPRLRVDARPGYPAYLGPVAATPEEFAVLVSYAATARDACMVGFLGGLGLRAGQVAALRREDVHLAPPGSRVAGCAFVHGPHLHVIRRDGHPRGAISKSRAPNLLPVPAPLVMLYAGWLHEWRPSPARAAAPGHLSPSPARPGTSRASR